MTVSNMNQSFRSRPALARPSRSLLHAMAPSRPMMAKAICTEQVRFAACTPNADHSSLISFEPAPAKRELQSSSGRVFNISQLVSLSARASYELSAVGRAGSASNTSTPACLMQICAGGGCGTSLPLGDDWGRASYILPPNGTASNVEITYIIYCAGEANVGVDDLVAERVIGSTQTTTIQSPVDITQTPSTSTVYIRANQTVPQQQVVTTTQSGSNVTLTELVISTLPQMTSLFTTTILGPNLTLTTTIHMNVTQNNTLSP